MKVVQTYATNEEAQKDQRLLTTRGISSRIAVDPLDGRTPALGTFEGVAILVDDLKAREATALLSRQPLKRAS